MFVESFSVFTRFSITVKGIFLSLGKASTAGTLLLATMRTTGYTAGRLDLVMENGLLKGKKLSKFLI